MERRAKYSHQRLILYLFHGCNAALAPADVNDGLFEIGKGSGIVGRPRPWREKRDGPDRFQLLSSAVGPTGSVKIFRNFNYFSKIK